MSGRLVATNVSRNAVLAESLELASSYWGKLVGLMGRASLASGAGLWMPGSNGIHMLFMRFPIDAVFLSPPLPSGRRRVLAVRRSLPAWRGIVWWVRGAKGVIELPAGTIERTGTERGDEVTIEAPADEVPGR